MLDRSRVIRRLDFKTVYRKLLPVDRVGRARALCFYVLALADLRQRAYQRQLFSFVYNFDDGIPRLLIPLYNMVDITTDDFHRCSFRNETCGRPFAGCGPR